MSNKRTDIIKKMMVMVKKILLMRQGPDCWICGKPAHDMAHLFVRNKLATAFDTTHDGNCHLLCRDCHSKDHSGELSPSYKDVYIERFGKEKYDELKERSNEDVGIVPMFIAKKGEELYEELGSVVGGWKEYRLQQIFGEIG